jgi:hypothetical protein
MIRTKILLLALLLLLAVTSCMATGVTTNDEAQIYAAAIREIHSFEHSRSLVYVVTKTEDYIIYEAATDPSQLLPVDLREAVTTELAAEPYQLVWIEKFDDASFDPANWRDAEGWRIADGEGMIITLGNIHPQDDGSVQLSFFMTCAQMCGIGKNFVLKQQNGVWRVTGSVGPEIAS